jgi:2-oxo-4-hydroxy-4-carboxy-5-ureidoimidazoline decarboxylase
MVIDPIAASEASMTGRSDLLSADTAHQFLQQYGHVFEHSPWLVERVWALHPFADATAIYQSFRQVVEALDRDDRLRLIRAHPELADKVAIARGLTDDSNAEQASAGLDRLTAAEFSRFQTLNDAYRTKHGFPFIICVRLHDKQGILSAMQRRVSRSTDDELNEAIEQINQISRLRLEALLT